MCNETQETTWALCHTNKSSTKQFKLSNMSTSRPLHHSAGNASHALLMIMFKDIPLHFFLLIQFCRILINSCNYLGKHAHCNVVIRLSENKLLEIMSLATYNFQEMIKMIQILMRIILCYFSNFVNPIKIKESHGHQRT